MKNLIYKFIVVMVLTMILLMMNSLEVQAKYLQEINLKVTATISNQSEDDEDLVFDSLSITYEKYDEETEDGKARKAGYFSRRCYFWY